MERGAQLLDSPTPCKDSMAHRKTRIRFCSWRRCPGFEVELRGCA